jgi:hypothetical protein
MTRFYKNILIFIVCVLVLSIACSNQDKTKDPAKDQSTQTVAPSVDSLTITLTARDSITVLNLLLETHKVDYWSTVAGVFVKGIDSVENGPRTFWVFSVNDTMPNIASDKVMAHKGDRIIWHFRKLDSK